MDQHESHEGNESTYPVEPSVWRVRDLPARLRPREEMDRVGVENVQDDVLLAILLRSGARGMSVVELAKSLLKDYGSLSAIAQASVDELAAKKSGMGRVKAQVLKASLELARRLNQESAPVRDRVKTPADAARILKSEAMTLDREVFWVIHLDSKNNVVKGSPHEVTKGILNASVVHPREVFRRAIKLNVAAVVVVHNHPSGDPSPSAEDVRITKQLVEAGKVVGIKVLDHVILGRPQGADMAVLSLRETGMVNFG